MCFDPAQIAEIQGAEIDLGHYLNAVERLQGVVTSLSRGAPPRTIDKHTTINRCSM